MNSVVRQLWEQNTDVVMVDTGNSYEGLCEYVGGKYISYTEEHPITMNPFRIQREELNVEKMDFLKNLIMLIWKGNSAIPTKIEELLIEQVIKEYYEAYFVGFKGYNKSQIDALHKNSSLRQPQRASLTTLTKRWRNVSGRRLRKWKTDARLWLLMNCRSTASLNTVRSAFLISAARIRLQA